MFRIRIFNNYQACPLKDRIYSQGPATSGLIEGIITPKLRNHKRKYNPKNIIDDMKLELGVDVTYIWAWQA
ncbi:hypothetical protein KY285_036206 [Solanum tuberosum]|nr:hypothetical protein KY285_036206 [Solanum tuberosum]